MNPRDNKKARTVLVTLTLWATACAERTPPEATLVVDSAGVEIVLNRNPTWSDSTAWRVDPEPTIQIGEREGTEETVFGRIRSVTRRADGTFAVAEGFSNEVRFFDSAGRHFATSGGSGDGPFEFRRLSLVKAVRGDTVLALDGLSSRTAAFGPDGAPIRGGPLPEGYRGMLISLRGWLADGSLIFGKLEPRRSNQIEPSWQSSPWFRVDPEGTEVTEMGEVLSTFGARNGSGQNVPLHITPFPVVAVGGDGVWFGPSTKFELTHVLPDGVVDRILRRDTEPRLLSAGQKQALRDYARYLAADQQRYGATNLVPAIILDTIPLLREALVDKEGNVWVQEFEPIDGLSSDKWPTVVRPGQSTWNVFNRSGIWLGTVEIPPDLTLHEVGADYILGVSADSLGVQSVYLHRLRKPEPSGGRE